MQCCCWMTAMGPAHTAAGAEPVFVTMLEHSPASPSPCVQATPAFFPKWIVHNRSSWILFRKSLPQSHPSSTSASPQIKAALFPVRTQSSSISMICFLGLISVELLWKWSFNNEHEPKIQSKAFHSHILPDESNCMSRIRRESALPYEHLPVQHLSHWEVYFP